MREEIRTICRRTYQKTIADDITIPSELRRALRTHERVPRFIDNLAQELSRVPKITKEEIEVAARDMTGFFLVSFVVSAEQRVLSPIEKHRRQRIIDGRKEFRESVEKMERGEFHGVVQDQKGETSFTKTEVEKLIEEK